MAARAHRRTLSADFAARHFELNGVDEFAAAVALVPTGILKAEQHIYRYITRFFETGTFCILILHI